MSQKNLFEVITDEEAAEIAEEVNSFLFDFMDMLTERFAAADMSNGPVDERTRTAFLVGFAAMSGTSSGYSRLFAEHFEDPQSALQRVCDIEQSLMNNTLLLGYAEIASTEIGIPQVDIVHE